MDRPGAGGEDRRRTAGRAIVVLTLDAAGEGCSAGLVQDGATLAVERHAGGPGSAAALARLAETVLRDAPPLEAIAVTVGPGSFTGLRAALSLAHGIALGSGVPVLGVPVLGVPVLGVPVLGVPVLGVSVGDAIRATQAGGRPLWVAMRARPGHVFLDDGATTRSFALESLPPPPGPIALAGDRAAEVAGRLAASGFDVQLLNIAAPDPAGIAAAAARAPRPALPLYVDAPVARPNPAPRAIPQAMPET